MPKRIIALLLILALVPCLALGEDVPERKMIRLVVNGETASPPGAKDGLVGGYIINDILYFPAGVIPYVLGMDVSYDEETDTLYVGTRPEAETPSHCWVLQDVTHEVDEDVQDGPRTWVYDYMDIPGGGRYIIDYTWQHNEEYSHYTVVGEVTNPPAVVQPNQVFTLSFKEYNIDVVGNPGWGILSMGYIQYDKDPSHYVFPKGFYTIIDGEYSSTAATYNAADGDQAFDMWAEFPEGVAGETITFTCQFHRGDRHPVITTWVYTWAE